jgi:hypothetical protein
MRKSTDNISARNSRTRKLVSYLFAGLMAFAQAGDIDTKSDSDNTIECESCKKTRERMIEKLRKIQESAPKKTEQTPKEDNDKAPKTLDLSDCDSCLSA